MSSGRRGFFSEYGEGSGREEECKSDTSSETETDNKNDLSDDIEKDSEIDKDYDFEPSLDFSGMEEYDFEPSLDFSGMEEYDFEPSLDFSEMDEYDFEPSLDFSELDQNDEENRLEPTGESDYSQEPDNDGKYDDNGNKSLDSSEEGKEIYENLNSESTSTVLISENAEEECNDLENSDQGHKEIEEIDQNELEREIEKELEEGVEAINHYLEEEAEFINAYQEMVGIERELDEDRANEGEERYKTEEEWEKEVENAAHIAEQLYGSIKEIEVNPNSEEISDINEELDFEKQVEQREEIIEPQLSDLKEETSEIYEELDEERDQIEQHQVEPLINEELETKPDPIIKEKDIEQLQELDLEEQFQKVLFNEYIEELVEKQEEEKNQLHDEIEQEKDNIEQTQEVIPQTPYLQEKLEESEQELELEYEEKDEIEQHQVEAAIEEELETESKPIINEEELEYIKSFEPEKQLDAELLYDLIEELAKKQKEVKAEPEEKEKHEELSTEENLTQIISKLEFVQEINSGETEVELNDQEIELNEETISQDEEVAEQFEIEERTDHQQELEEILKQISKIEQEALNEIKPREDDSDKIIEKNYEKVKKFYKQQTGKRPIYADKETIGFKQWLEQKKKSEEKEKIKQKKELKEERKKEEAWKRSLKNWIEQATEIEPELKSELKKLVEKYNELEKLIKKYIQLYIKAKREELSQTEKKELKLLNKALQKRDSIKFKLFQSIQEIKHYLEGQYYYDFWDKPRINQKLSHFFTHLSQKYSSLKQLQKMKNNTEKVLKNWIENVSEEEISSELKAELKELIENYNELDAVAIMFMKLYTRMEILSETAKKELDSLVKTLQKLDPSKIELFTQIRAIKHYLIDKVPDDLSNKARVHRLISRFFAQFEQISYNTKDLIEDLRNEIQMLSEELAVMFPNRLMTERGNKYSHAHLSRLWGMSESYIGRYLLNKAKKVSEEALFRLREILEEKLGSKASGCVEIINMYQSNELTILQFVDLLEKELGKVSGEIKVTDEELGLILAGTPGSIKIILARIRQPAKFDYNPDYKFSKERLDEFRDSLFEIFGIRANKCFGLLERYKHLNPNLKKYSQQQYTITEPTYFHNIEEDPETSYWFGFLHADGSRSGEPYRISFELAEKDKDRLERFADAVGFPIDRIKFRTRYHRYVGELRAYKTGYIKFACRPMAKQIDKLGFQNSKAKQKILPDYIIQALQKAKKTSKQTHIDWWLTLPGQVALAFLLGFYDGDGTYMGFRSARILSSSKLILEQIKELFEIKNKVLPAKVPGEIAWAFDREYVSKGLYSLALGPKLFDMMMNSFEHSMDRKCPQDPTKPVNSGLDA